MTTLNFRVFRYDQLHVSRKQAYIVRNVQTRQANNDTFEPNDFLHPFQDSFVSSKSAFNRSRRPRRQIKHTRTELNTKNECSLTPYLVMFATTLSRIMKKSTKWYMRLAKTQINLGIRPVWSESSLSARRKLRSLATHWAHSEDSDQTRRMPRLIWVFPGRTCHFVGFVMMRLKSCLSCKSRYRRASFLLPLYCYTKMPTLIPRLTRNATGKVINTYCNKHCRIFIPLNT